MSITNRYRIDRLAGYFMLLTVLALAPFSCTEEIQWELDFHQEEVIVVEGKITNEVRQHEVRLTRPVYEMNGTPETITGAVVEINDGRTLHLLTEDPARPGTYLTDARFAGTVNQGYQLRIGLGDKRYTAVAFMHEVTPIQFMRVVRVQDQPPLYEAYISNDSEGSSIVRLELDWSHLTGYDTLPYEDNHALIYHYSLNSVDVNRFFSPERERVWFPPGTIVYREKESVSREYAEFLRGMLSETDWRGGIFDVLPGNARTNLSEGAIGFFTAAAVIRDTLVVP
jgi:hypothetical protein